jgi:hypothetical protein
MMTIDPRQAIPVDSVGQEYALVAAAACACGGRWRVTCQALLSHEGRCYDRLEVACPRCGQTGAFLFDISTFFGT